MDSNTAEERIYDQQDSAAAHKDRRYVGTKETVAYILYDIAQSFNINKYSDIFITDIVKIGLRFQEIVSFVVGLWDMVNDVIDTIKNGASN